MNRNYKVIWNEASRCFVAVAEYAKTRGKSSGAVVSSHSSDSRGVVQSVPLFRLKALRSGLLAVGLSSLALGMSPQVSAAVGISGGTGSGTAASECVGAAQANSGINPENIAIGCEAETSNVGLYIADRGNPYYTDNVTNASSVAAADRNAYTPRGEAGGAIAIGTGATTEKAFGVALGDYAKTTEIAGVAIGVGTLSKGNTALAIGRQSAAIADYSQAIGNVAAATGKGALAVGHSAAATGYRAIAIGATDIDSASESYGQPNANYQANGQTKATADDTIAFGSGAAASAATAIAIGKSSTATRVGSVALGANASTATAANGVTSAMVNGRTFGGFAGSTGISAGDQVSVGAAGAERQIKNVAAGNVTAVSTDAINGSQLFSVANTLGQDITNNTTAIGNNTTSINTNTTNITTNSDNIAKGIKFNVNGGERTYALGESIGVTTDSNLITTPTTDGVNVALANTLNIGSANPVTINGEDGTVSGLTNTSFDDTATYTGGLAATQEQLSALNSNINNTVNQGLDFTGDNTLVTVNRKFGQKLTVKGGEDNVTNLTDNNIGVIADDSDGSLTVKLAKDLVGLNSADFGGVNISATGINANNTKITNVRDGTIAAGSTDAVNGGQLNAQGNGVKNIIGGDTVYNPATGSFTNTNIGGTGQNTIDEAIKTVTTSVAKAKTTVSQGDNIVVTETTNADGSTDYNVATAPDLAVDSVTTGNSTLNNNGLAINDGTGNTTTITTAGTTVTNAAGNSASYGANGFSASDSAGNSTIINQGGVSFTDSNGDATGPTITALGVDAGNTVITNVASGGDVASNAANIGDVQAAAAASKTQVAAGTNVSSVTKTLGAAGQDIYTVNANGTSVSAGSSAVSVTAGVKNANNVTDYAVDLSQATKNSLISADNALQSVVTQIDGVDVKTINKTNNTANFVTGNNIVLSNDNGNIKVATAQDLTVTSIKTGNTTVNNNGVTIEGGPSLTTNGINAGGQVITGVGAGTNANDAVNVGQLTNFNTAINSEIANIDRNLNDLGYRVGEVEDDANAGISAAMAMSSLPQSFIPGKSMMGGGIASYNGESAVAIGVSKVSDNGRWVIKVNGSADTQGNAGGSIGAGFHF